MKDVVESVQRDNLQDGDSLHIDVRRWCFIDDAIREGKKTKFDLNKRLRVQFVGEVGVDTGGPRREFFRLLVQHGSTRYLRGMCGKMTFTSNTIACQRGELKILGNYVAMSIAQGGSGFPVLHPSVYNYIVTGKYIGVRIPDEDIPNPIVNAMLKQLNECCDDASIRAVFASAEHQEALFATGYSQPIMCISIGNKHEISDALKCHFMLKAVIPEINEFAEGLDVLGILDYRLYPKDPGHYERFVCRCASSSNSCYDEETV